MVSRTEFQRVLDRTSVPLLGFTTAARGANSPNVEVSRSPAAQGEGMLERIRRIMRGGFAPGASSAVAAARDSLDRRFARAVASATVIEGVELADCVARMHGQIDDLGYAQHDRLCAMSPSAWRAAMADRAFSNAPEVMGGRLVKLGPAPGDRYMIWFPARYLEVPAVMFHKTAIEARIEPFDASPGQSASAHVSVRVLDENAVRVLSWPQ